MKGIHPRVSMPATRSVRGQPGISRPGTTRDRYTRPPLAGGASSGPAQAVDIPIMAPGAP